MGLMLSLLVVCVGVIEALSCYEHFQYGVLHCATNVYERARRRSSVFLKYTSRRLKLLSENSISEHEEQPEINVFQPNQNSSFDSQEQFLERESDQFLSIRKPKPIQKEPLLKKLEKEDKIQIVKTLLERPRRPKTVRSISMPELVQTEEDIELSKIINDLAIEPIEEIDDLNSQKEFDELFNEYESSGEHYGSQESPLDDFQDKNSDDLDRFEEKKFPLEQEGICDTEKSMNEAENNEDKFILSENDVRNKEISNFQHEIKSGDVLEKNEKKPVAGVIKANISERVSDKGAAYFQETLNRKGSIRKGQGSGFERSTSVDFSKVKSLMINKPAAMNLHVLSEMSNDSPELILDESISRNKLEDIIFESDTPPVEVIDKTFDEIYENICDESADITNIFKEIEKNIFCDETNVEAELGRQSDNQPNPSDETSLGFSNEKTISNAVFLKAVEQLAELLVRDSINLHKIKTLLFKNSNSLNGHEKFFPIEDDPKLGFGPESQLEDETISMEGNTTSKESVCSVRDMPDMNTLKEDENINGEEKPVSQELPDSGCLRADKTEAFSTEVKVNITDSKVEEEIQKNVCSVVTPEKPNLLGTHLELGSESAPVRFESVENLWTLSRDINAGIEFPDKVEISKITEDSSKSDMTFVKESLEEAFRKEIPKGPPETGNIENIKESPSQLELNEFPKVDNAVVELHVIGEPKIVPTDLMNISEAGMTLSEGDVKKDFEKEILKAFSESENIKPIAENVMVPPESGNVEIVERKLEFSGNDNVVVEFPVVTETKEVTKNTGGSSKELEEKNAKGDFLMKIIKDFSESELVEKIEELPHDLENFSGNDSNCVVEFPVKSNNMQLPIEIENSLRSDMAPTEGDAKNNFETFSVSENIKSIVESVIVPPKSGNTEILAGKSQLSGNDNAVVELIVINDIKEVPNEVKDISKSGTNFTEVDAKKDFQKEELKNIEPIVENVLVSPEPKEIEFVAEKLHISADGNAVVEFPVINETEDSSAKLIITKNEETIKKEIATSFSVSGNNETPIESITKLPEGVMVDSNKTVTEAVVIVEKGYFLPNDVVSELKKPQEDEPLSVKYEPQEEDVKSEVGTSQDRISDACSDIINENIQAVESKTLALEHKIEGKPDLITETKGLSEINIEKNLEKTHLRNVEQLIETSEGAVIEFPERAGESEKNVKFEQVGTAELTLLEESQAEKTLLGMAGPVPGSAVKKGEHFRDSKNLKENKATSSEPEAFWLIFSGEYTKAMSKDWHSGHFSCWQCDEALTGQRYVLRDDHPYCIKCYESVFANVCEECNKIIGIDSKDLSYKDKHWHEACFLCNKCRVSLVDKQFGSKADKIYCGNCYDAQFASRCDGCGEIFRAGTKKMEYKTRQWHEKCFCCCVCKTPIGTKSFIPREQEIYCATCYEEKFATRCVKCNKIITSGGVTYKNEPWHRECFTCTNCNTSLAGQRFTSRDEKPYCADCFGELFAKRCTACSRPITGIGGTRFISFEDRHWHNDCFICASCKTSLVGRGFITDGDDIICPECAKQKLM